MHVWIAKRRELISNGLNDAQLEGIAQNLGREDLGNLVQISEAP